MAYLKHPPKIRPDDLKIVVVAVTDSKGRVLLVRRSRDESHRAGEWETPGGHRKKGEPIADAGRREVKEETGLDVSIGGARSYFSIREGGYGVMLRGVATNGSDIDLDTDEHDKHHWATKGQLGKFHPTPPDFVKTVRAVIGARHQERPMTPVWLVIHKGEDDSRPVDYQEGQAHTTRDSAEKEAERLRGIYPYRRYAVETTTAEEILDARTPRRMARSTKQNVKHQDPHDVIEETKPRGDDTQAIFENIDDPAWGSMYGLTTRPDLDEFEEVITPASMDGVFQRFGQREPGEGHWGDNHWGATVHTNVLKAVDDMGLTDEVVATNLGDETEVATVDPRHAGPLRRAIRKAGLIDWPSRTNYRFRISAPRFAIVRKEGDEWYVRSKKGKSLGHYPSQSQAQERLRQVEYWKKRKAKLFGLLPDPATTESGHDVYDLAKKWRVPPSFAPSDPAESGHDPTHPATAKVEQEIQRLEMALKHVKDPEEYRKIDRALLYWYGHRYAARRRRKRAERAAAVRRPDRGRNVYEATATHKSTGKTYTYLARQDGSRVRYSGDDGDNWTDSKMDALRAAMSRAGDKSTASRRAAPMQIQLPKTQANDPTKSVQQTLGDKAHVSPNMQGGVTVQTDDPKAAIKQLDKAVDQNQLTIGQPSLGPTVAQIAPLAPQTPIMPTASVRKALQATRAKYAGRPWYRGVIAAGRGVGVRVACGCGGGLDPLMEPRSLPPQIGGVPLHILVIHTGDPPGGHLPRDDSATSQKLAGRRPKAGRVATERDPDANTEVTSAAPAPHLDRRLKLHEDPAYTRAVVREQAKLDNMMRQHASPDAISTQQAVVQKAQHNLELHLEHVHKGPRRDPRWTNLQGIVDSALEFRESHGGEAGYQAWYDRHKGDVEEFFGAEAPIFYKMLAATSPRTKVGANVTLALKAYQQWKAAEQGGYEPTWQGFIGSHRKNLTRAIKGEELSGPKVNPFGGATAGEEEPPATIDMWMARLYFGIDKPTTVQLRKGQEITAEVARRIGQSVKYTQGLLWEMIRAHWGEKPEDFSSALQARLPKFQQAQRQGNLFDRYAPTGSKKRRAAGDALVDGMATVLVQMLKQTVPAQKLQPVVQTAPQPPAQPVASRRQAGLIRELGDRPSDHVGTGDWVKVSYKDGRPDVEGFVDRVSRTHLWVRAHPRVHRDKMHLDGVDWRERAGWSGLTHRAKGESRHTHYVPGKKKAPVVSMFQDAVGMGDSFFGGLGEEIRNQAEERIYKKRPEQDVADHAHYRAGNPTRAIMSAERLELQEHEYHPMLQERVDNYDSLIEEATFATNHLGAPDAWDEVWHDWLKPTFPALGIEDKKDAHARWKRLRRQTASRGRSVMQA